MTHTALIIVGFLAIVAGATVFATHNAEKSDAITSDLETLSEIELTDYRGSSVSLGDYRGKPLVVNSWATWCPFCKRELPDFAQLQSEFPSIVVIAVDRAEPLEAAKSYTDSFNISDSMVFLMDAGDDFYTSMGGFSMPETLFIDQFGTIVFHKRGPLTLEEMRQSVREHLSQE